MEELSLTQHVVIVSSLSPHVKLTATHIQPNRLPLTREIEMTVLLLMEMLKALKHLIANSTDKSNVEIECLECFNVSFIFKVNQSQLFII